MKTWYTENREHWLAYRREWRRKNRDRLNQQQLEINATHRDAYNTYQRAHYLANADARRAAKLAYADCDRVREMDRFRKRGYTLRDRLDSRWPVFSKD